MFTGLVIGILAIFLVSVMAQGITPQSPNLRDTSEKVSKAGPTTGATIYSDSLATGNITGAASGAGGVDYLITMPAVATGALADAATLTLSILTDTVDPIDASSTVFYPNFLVQTGAGGAGAAAATKRFRLPSNADAKVGFKVVNSGTGNTSSGSITLEKLF